MNKGVEQKTKRLPTFRGRFGTRTKRSSSIAKWDKWRFPQGIDIKWKRGDGNLPGIGYRSKKEYRDLHPKGLPEFYIRSQRDIDKFDKKSAKNYVFRFASNLGLKKRAELLKKANELGMHILNE